MKKAIYARTAVKNNNAIKLQIDRIKKMFKLNKFSKYIDDGKSGVSLDRPGLRKLLQDAKKGKIGTLYIADTDRLSRNSFQLAKIINDLGDKVKIVKCDADRKFNGWKIKKCCRTPIHIPKDEWDKVQNMLIKRFEKNRLKDDGITPEKKFMDDVLAVFATYERNVASQRIKNGIARSKRKK